jgi:hypothetical protein
MADKQADAQPASLAQKFKGKLTISRSSLPYLVAAQVAAESWRYYYDLILPHYQVILVCQRLITQDVTAAGIESVEERLGG